MPQKADITSSNRINTLVNALAEKGTPGIILLGIIFLTIWTPVGFIVYKFFDFIGLAKDFPEITSAGPILGIVIVGLLGAAYIYVAYLLTSKIMTAMIPTIKAEAEAAKLMSEAIGGRVMTYAGTIQTLAVDQRGAETRTKQIMKVLLDRAKSLLRLELVRTNIFTLHEDGKLRILEGFHVNMQGPMAGENELSIAIPSGLLSSGRAYRYFRPVLSLKSPDGKWPYASDTESTTPDIIAEVQKAHPDLKWIISMPIPYQVQPFKLVGGVLNIDGLGTTPNKDQMRELLTDMSTAATLIAVLNRSTGFLRGEYTISSEPSSTEQEDLKGFLIAPEEFDPACCPEPSSEFVTALGHIKGLEFFTRISPAEIANYLRDQLAS